MSLTKKDWNETVVQGRSDGEKIALLTFQSKVFSLGVNCIFVP